MKIAYFAHDLNDAAIKKRGRMLVQSGADLALAGFYRGLPPNDADKTFIFGQTEDGNFIQRLSAIFTALAKFIKISEFVKDSDIIIARNLEMLLIASFFQGRKKQTNRKIIYECLDIHRLLLGDRWINKLMRCLEKILLSKTHKIIISSPAFADEYFHKVQGFSKEIILIENKVYYADLNPILKEQKESNGFWVIGWFGNIRCAKSLRLLGIICDNNPNIKVLIAGKPAYSEFDNFDGFIAKHENIEFIGAYDYADIGKLYNMVHFAWAIDYFEEGQNSKYLLPNRIYEAGYNHIVPIALSETQTAKWLIDKGIGVIITNPIKDLEGFFNDLDNIKYTAMKNKIIHKDISNFKFTDTEINGLLDRLN